MLLGLERHVGTNIYIIAVIFLEEKKRQQFVCQYQQPSLSLCKQRWWVSVGKTAWMDIIFNVLPTKRGKLFGVGSKFSTNSRGTRSLVSHLITFVKLKKRVDRQVGSSTCTFDSTQCLSIFNPGNFINTMLTNMEPWHESNQISNNTGCYIKWKLNKAIRYCYWEKSQPDLWFVLCTS